ncbi:HNH endonuclease family protein [Corynebacterium kroppenstedtii]|uniref:HNH endonuclease family protein n=1 Tax=Corynebacterium sp. PCR 32 TaxID=3351342 RepID=UPI0030972F3F
MRILRKGGVRPTPRRLSGRPLAGLLSLCLVVGGLVGCGGIYSSHTSSSQSTTSPHGSPRGNTPPAGRADGSLPPHTDLAHTTFPGNPKAERVGQLSTQESADALASLTTPFPDGDIHALLAALPESPRRGGAERYQRINFGPAWADVDHNGCDTRNDILHRDLTNITTQPPQGCSIRTGTLHDPYTGRTIDFRRGKKTSQAVQIDHVVALSNAWASGAYALPYPARVALANDPLNLLAVDGPANNEKSDSDASEWMPPNAPYRCGYADRQVRVKTKYHLHVTRQEKAALSGALSQCPK